MALQRYQSFPPPDPLESPLSEPLSKRRGVCDPELGPVIGLSRSHPRCSGFRNWPKGAVGALRRSLLGRLDAVIIRIVHEIMGTPEMSTVKGGRVVGSCSPMMMSGTR